jgi:hypothetical protein
MDQMASPLMWTPPAPGSYVREGFAEGLRLGQQLGANPFALGLIASTDTHLATPGLVDEDRFAGHAAGTVSARLAVPPLPDRIDFNPGGLAVLWAEENSRDALFDAMRRREAYGTRGPRLQVRFFAGYDYAPELCSADDFAAQGYAGGVPMGGELPAPAADQAPAFAVSALKDPGTLDAAGTDLQRIQIVKIWLDGDTSREAVFDVAGDAANGASVDPLSCNPTGRGFDQLCTVWRDPGFDPAAPALYYARVVENPSCRWNAWACLAARVDCANPGSVPDALAPCCDDAVPKTIQERAWTSPIFYTPTVEMP